MEEQASMAVKISSRKTIACIPTTASYSGAGSGKYLLLPLSLQTGNLKFREGKSLAKSYIAG